MGTITERANSMVNVAHDLVRLSAHHLEYIVVLAHWDTSHHDTERPLALPGARRTGDELASQGRLVRCTHQK